MHKYFFVLGTNPTLSIAELSAVFNAAKSQIINKDILLIETEENINAKDLIKNLGGTIKIGLITSELKQTKITNSELLDSIIENFDLKNITGKFKFGFSLYGKSHLNLKPLAMEFKKYLKNSGLSSRWVTSSGESRFAQVLSSVVVVQNKLTGPGLEIVLINNNDYLYLGKTLAVQPFKELSFRDYGRPARDDYSGMLPPKLAQIMINLAMPHPTTPSLISPLPRGRNEVGVNKVILDPFCGSGTILTEAALMGFKNLIGSDISKKAIEDTKKNINWIIENWKLKIENLELYQQDVQNISQKLKPSTINAIITEPYLGPPRGKHDLNKIINELEKLYTRSLAEFKKILKPNGRIIMVWPVFRHLSLRGAGSDLPTAGRRSNLTNTYKPTETVNPKLNVFKIISPLPANLIKNPVIKLTDRNTIIYGRPGQKVWREIVILNL